MASGRDLLAKVITRVHRKVYRASKGRVGGSLFGSPVVMLTTTGRKSGLPHTVMVGAPIREPGRVVVAGSHGGADHDPQWVRNVRSNPTVAVVSEGREQMMTARVADANERAALWPELVRAMPSYEKYQAKTTRQFPVVIMEPPPSNRD